MQLLNNISSSYDLLVFLKDKNLKALNLLVLKDFSYEFVLCEELKSWSEYDINLNFDKIILFYNKNTSLNKIYCRLHGKTVEYMKQGSKD